MPLTREDISEAWERAKENVRAERACPRHDFEVTPETAGKAFKRYRCKHCKSEIDGSKHYWYERGRKAATP